MIDNCSAIKEVQYNWHYTPDGEEYSWYKVGVDGVIGINFHCNSSGVHWCSVFIEKDKDGDKVTEVLVYNINKVIE